MRPDPAGAEIPLAKAVREAGSVVIISLAEIGDAVLLSPFLSQLRRVAATARITLVCRPAVASLFEHCPYVDTVLEYEPRARRLLRPLVLPFRAWGFAREHLRPQRFGVAIVPRWDTDHHFATALALFSGAQRRVAYSEDVNGRKRVLNAGFDSLLTDVVHERRAVHEVEHHLALLRLLGGSAALAPIEVWTDRSDSLVAQAHLPDEGLTSRAPLIAFGIGAADPKRRWPAEHFAALGELLHERLGAHMVLVGGPADSETQAIVVAKLGTAVTPLAGALTLRQSAAALQACRLFVGNDSGALHLAAAAGIPCVEISCHPIGADARHNNAPERFAPWGVPHVVLRPPAAMGLCSQACQADVPHCILGVDVEVALAACESLLPTGAKGGLAVAAARCDRL